MWLLSLLEEEEGSAWRQYIISLFNPIQYIGVQVSIIARAHSVHAILRAPSVLGQNGVNRCLNINVFGISMTNVFVWNYFGNDLRQFLKKIFFFAQRSPIWISGDLSTSFWAKGGFYL